MLRNKSLIPLSHQHQHALALCVRIDRASPIPSEDLAAWESELAQLVQTEIEIHFAAEEAVVFPAACGFAEMTPLVDELVADHAWLRGHFAAAPKGSMSADHLQALAGRLSAHIRKEERQLFERLQALMSAEDLALLGAKLDEALKGSTQVCAVPANATRLRPAR
jgi:iron-sulfur cluster repair protein YtfE (RIC family)